MKVALQYIDTLGAAWEPARHRDEHRERLLNLLHDKAGEAIAVPEEHEEALTATATAIDLMEALQASVDAARRAREGEDRQTG
jgi:DNA end-binding protein Ku